MKKSKIDKNQELELVELYKNGTNTLELCKKYGWSLNNRHGPLDILKRHNIVIRPDNKTCAIKYTINSNYFNSVDSKDKAYFLGLIYADGSISKNGINRTRSEMKLQLQEQDKSILETFNKYLNSNKPLRFTKAKQIQHSNSFGLGLENTKLIENLKKLGVNPNKSYTLEFPSESILPKHLVPHFIRGFFDGDGCITQSSGSANINFSSTRQMLVDLKEILYSEVGFNKNVKIQQRYKDRKDISCQLMYGGNIQVKKFYDWLYKDCGNLYIERKKLKFEKLLKI